MSDHAIVVDGSDVPRDSWSDPLRGQLAFRTLIGDRTTATDSLTAGVTEMEPGGRLERHRHRPPEIYYILQGEATVVLDGQEHAVRAGSAVFIPGNLEHGIWNAGAQPLRFFYVFPVGSFADIEYHFPGCGEG